MFAPLQRKGKMKRSEFFSKFLKLLDCYGDIIVIDSTDHKDGQMSFHCHIISAARIADLGYICCATNTPNSVYSNHFSELGELPEDSFKKLVWGFFFRLENSEYAELNGEEMSINLFDFYTMVLRDAKKKNLMNEQEIAHFETYLNKVSLSLIIKDR